MEKIKHGKMGKKEFWITILISWALIILLPVSIETGDWLGDVGRGVVGTISFVIYMTACVMRLRDAGKKAGLAVILFIIPVYMFVLASYASEEPHEADAQNETE